MARLRNQQHQFGLISKCLHWTIALSMFGLIALGWYMVDLTYYDRWYNRSLELHKSLGMVVFALGLSMVVWKWVSPSPLLNDSLPQWQKLSAVIMHRVLLALVVAIPITGYLISTSAGKSIMVFGALELPAIMQVDETLRDLSIRAHYYLAYGVGIIALGHAGAALKHQLIDRDGTLAQNVVALNLQRPYP